MKNLNFSRLFDNKTFCKIFSIVGAIIMFILIYNSFVSLKRVGQEIVAKGIYLGTIYKELHLIYIGQLCERIYNRVNCHCGS